MIKLLQRGYQLAYTTPKSPIIHPSPSGATGEKKEKLWLIPIPKHSQLDDVVDYIKNQEAHHARQTFKEEYLELLSRFDVPYNPKYVFDPVDENTLET